MYHLRDNFISLWLNFLITNWTLRIEKKTSISFQKFIKSHYTPMKSIKPLITPQYTVLICIVTVGVTSHEDGG